MRPHRFQTRAYLLPLIAVICSLLAVNSVRADILDPPMVLETVEVGRYNSLVSEPRRTVPRGFVSKAHAPEGQSFLVLWIGMKLDPPKDARGNRVLRVEHKEMVLTDAAGNEHLSIGRCSRDGRFEPYPMDFSHFGKPPEGLVAYDLVFLVPRGQDSFTLRFGNAEKSLSAPVEMLEPIDPSAAAEFRISDVKVLEEIELQREVQPLGKQRVELSETLEATTGRFIAVTLVARGKIANADSGNFVFTPGDIGLLYGGRVYAAPVGRIGYGGKFSTGSLAYNGGPDGKGGYLQTGGTLVFPLPEGVTRFDVLYLLHHVARGNVPE